MGLRDSIEAEAEPGRVVGGRDGSNAGDDSVVSRDGLYMTSPLFLCSPPEDSIHVSMLSHIRYQLDLSRCLVFKGFTECCVEAGFSEYCEPVELHSSQSHNGRFGSSS